MAREHAAISETCEPLKPTEGNPHEGQSTREKSPLTAQALAERLRAAEPLLRKLAPGLLGIFALTVVTGFTLQILTNRAETLADSAAEIEMLSLAVQPELTASFSNNRIDPLKASAQLQRILPKSKIDQGVQIVIANEQGQIIASLPADLGKGEALTSYFGQTQPMTVMAENAGVGALVLPNGAKALAMARRIGPNGALSVTLQPVSSALQRWRERSWSMGMLLLISLLVTGGMALAFFWQSWRVKKADDAYLRMQARMNTALSRGRCGLWDWDIARGSLHWSDSMYEMLGYQRNSEFLAFGEINALIHPEDEDLYSLAQRLAADHETTVDHSFRLLSAHGEWVWLRARAQLILDKQENRLHLVGIAVDMSDQRRLEAENETANLRLREAIEAFGESFVLWDADNRMVMCNSRFQKLHNLSADMTRRGTPYQDIAPFLTRPTHHAAADTPSDNPALNGHYIVRMPDNRWLQLIEKKTNDGGFVSVATDITQIKDAERRQAQMISDLKRSRHALEKQAEELNELVQRYYEQMAEAESANRAKSEFLAKMSHDLRTPLNAILGFSEIMEQEMFGPLGHNKYRDYCHDISKSGSALLAVIADILDMSELEAGKVKIERETLPIDPTLKSAFESVRKEAESKGLTLIPDLVADGTLYADPRAINRILGHLLKNAVKFTPAGGRVVMRSRIVSGALNIYIEDNGVGIPKEALPKLAQPFTWVDLDASKPSDGSGLGLAIARSFVELHGGGLRIRSNEGSGTIVLVRLPLRDTPTKMAA